MVFEYNKVVLGGTFDLLHIGHKKLLSVAFEKGKSVEIGVISDNFARKMGKQLNNNFKTRVKRLEKFLQSNFPQRYQIISLDDYFGPAAIASDIDAIVVSKEVLKRAEMINELRIINRVKPLNIVTVDMVIADDGLPISSSRIKAKQIDENGHIIQKLDI